MLSADPCLGLCVSLQRQGLPPVRELAGCGAWRYTDELNFRRTRRRPLCSAYVFVCMCVGGLCVHAGLAACDAVDVGTDLTYLSLQLDSVKHKTPSYRAKRGIKVSCVGG